MYLPKICIIIDFQNKKAFNICPLAHIDVYLIYNTNYKMQCGTTISEPSQLIMSSTKWSVGLSRLK